MKFWKRCKGRLLFTILGFAAAISFLTLGFVKTMVILLCCVLGYLIGALHDKSIHIPDSLQFWRKKW